MDKIRLSSKIVIFVDKIAVDSLIQELKQDLVKSQFCKGEGEEVIAEHAIINLKKTVISNNMLVITFDSIFSKYELQEILKEYSKKATFIFEKEETLNG